MIIDPDFLNHWRTKMLSDALGEDQLAPLYVIRIWAHCQTRKNTRFCMPTKGIAALCQFKGDAEKLESELISSGFIVRDGDDIEVPGWAAHNKKLIANWENGATGGRPQKTQQEPNNNQIETQQEPTGTQQEPIRLREDLDKIKSKTRSRAKRGSRLTQSWSAPQEYLDFCKTERPDLDAKAMEDKFRDYWSAVAGKNSAKLDWFATWRNFVRGEFGSLKSQSKPEKFNARDYVNGKTK